MKLKDKMKTYSFWISLVSAILIVVRIIFEQCNLFLNDSIIMDIVTGICGVLVLLGILTAPTTKEETLEDSTNKQELTLEQEHLVVEETGLLNEIETLESQINIADLENQDEFIGSAAAVQTVPTVEAETTTVETAAEAETTVEAAETAAVEAAETAAVETAESNVEAVNSLEQQRCMQIINDAESCIKDKENIQSVVSNAVLLNNQTTNTQEKPKMQIDNAGSERKVLTALERFELIARLKEEQLKNQTITGDVCVEDAIQVETREQCLNKEESLIECSEGSETVCNLVNEIEAKSVADEIVENSVQQTIQMVTDKDSFIEILNSIKQLDKTKLKLLINEILNMLCIEV